jgi:hypothetical protein
MSKKSFLASLLLIFSLFSCGGKPNQMHTDEFSIKIEALKTSMISYMESAKPSYSKRDVDECISILNEYTKQIAATTTKEQGMQIVKSTILKLNDLNDKCNGELIETGEREQIAEIIILAGNKKGYNAIDEDITEDWREW